MGRRINSSIYRVGKNIGWDFFYPSIYFNKGMRFQIMFGLLVTKLMFLAGLRLIKIIVNLETNKVKFFLIAVSLFKDEPMARFFTDFKAGNFPIVSFDEPRGFTKAKDTRTYDTFYNDIPGENVNEGALFNTPVSITDNFFENFAIQPLDSARRCEKEIEYATDDIKMRRIASRVFLLYYIEKLSRRRRFNAVEVTSVISDIFKTKGAEENLHYVYTLKKILGKSKKKNGFNEKISFAYRQYRGKQKQAPIKKNVYFVKNAISVFKKK